MTVIHYTGDALWNRIERAVEKVRQRLERVTNCPSAMRRLPRPPRSPKPYDPVGAQPQGTL